MKKWRPPVGLLAWLANRLVQCIIKSSKLEIHGLENLTLPKDRKHIIMLWHNQLTIAPHILHKLTPQINYAAVVSSSKDGELLAQMVARFSNGSIIRVPHDLRHAALKEMVKTLREKEVVPVITPDGPRGPAFVIKGGIAVAARGANALVVPMSWTADRFWEFGTWDRMRLPKPFSKISLHFGEPIDLKNVAGDEALKLLEQGLNQYLF